MQVRWDPKDDAEKALFQPALEGDAAALARYAEHLKGEGVPAKAVEQMSATLARLGKLRQG
jgi:hypothetical protein